MCLKKGSYSPQDCIYLIKKYNKNCDIVKHFTITVFYLNIFANLIHCCDGKAEFYKASSNKKNETIKLQMPFMENVSSLT